MGIHEGLSLTADEIEAWLNNNIDNSTSEDYKRLCRYLSIMGFRPIYSAVVIRGGVEWFVKVVPLV